MKQISVVAAVIEKEGKILCVQRGPSSLEYISQKWEFPGGKIEALFVLMKSQVGRTVK